MANEIIRPSQLPSRPSPVASEVIPVDNGVTVGGATVQKIVEAGRPAANQAEAEAGVNATKAMTPLTTKQAIDAQVPDVVAGAIAGLNLGTAAQADVADFATAAQGALADSAVQPGDLGTAAAADASDFATAAQGAKADEAVSFAEAQSLSPSQRQQARENIGAVGQELIQTYSPFGRTGFKPVVGDGYGLHCGWGGIMPFASGKWVMVYRQASTHAITNGAQLRARDSYDQGATWVNDRLVYTEVDNDARPDAPRIMGSNRGGFFVNRQANPTATRKFPLFFKTDDEGVTFTSQVVETASTTYTFQGHSGLMNWPASKGGHDTEGFMSFGYVAPGGLGALRTSDNGDSWEYVTDVAVASMPLSEILQSPGFNGGTGWTLTAPWSIAEGKLIKVSGSGNAYAALAGYEAGTEVVITLNIESISGSSFKLAFFANGTPLDVESGSISTPGVHTVRLTIPATANRLYLIGAANGLTMTLTHLSLRAQPTGGTTITSISESTGVRLKNPDRWVFWSRINAGGWRQMLTTWVTEDPFDWGAPLDAGVDQWGNPPGGFIDYDTGKISYLSIGRGGRGINGFDHHLLIIEADAEDLYNAAGSFAALDLEYSVLTPVPNWATGYVAPFFDDGAWWATLTFGESGVSGGEHGAVGLIGDFVPTTADALKLVDFFLRRQMGVRSVTVIADDNLQTTYPLTLQNAAGNQTARFGAYAAVLPAGFELSFSTVAKWTDTELMIGMQSPTSVDAWLHVAVPSAAKVGTVTFTGSAQLRTHYALVNGNGLVGGLFTIGSRSGFRPTADPDVAISGGAGSPEGVVTAKPGAIWMRTDGGAGTSLYVKETGTGNTGWVAK